MTVSGAISAIGTLLYCDNLSGSSGSYVLCAEVGDVAGPNMKTNMADVTSHSASGSPAFEQSIPTTHGMGQLKFPVNFIPTDTTHNYAAGVLKLWYNRTVAGWKVVFPDAGATAWTFQAYVSGVDMKAAVKGVLTADITLDITGVPTLA